MSPILSCILGFAGGTIFGVFILATMIAGSEADDYLDKLNKGDNGHYYVESGDEVCQN